MKTYKQMKAAARDEAIEWQNTFHEKNYSYEELASWTDYFWYIARRFGLVKEFRENGII